MIFKFNRIKLHTWLTYFIKSGMLNLIIQGKSIADYINGFVATTKNSDLVIWVKYKIRARLKLTFGSAIKHNTNVLSKKYKK